MKGSPARRVAFTGMLFALAVVLGLLESLLTPALGLPPGVKPGLANIVVLYALFFLQPLQALALVLLKAGLAAATRGAVAGALSLCGGLLSLAVMAALLRLKSQPGTLLISVAGALAHNLGQLALFSVLFGVYSWAYLPVLVVSGVVMGAITALSLRALTPGLARISSAIAAPKGQAAPPTGPPAGAPPAEKPDEATERHEPPLPGTPPTPQPKDGTGHGD